MKLAIVIHSMGGGGAERVTATLAQALTRRGWAVTIVTLEAGDDFHRVDPAVRRVALGLAGESRGLVQALRANLQRLRALRAFLRRERPDVVLGMASAIAVLTILSAQGLGLRVVVSERIHPPALPLGRAWETLRALAYRRADRIVALSIESRRWLEARVGRPDVMVIPNPVALPLAEQSPRLSPEQSVGEGERLLLAVGRLDPQKGFDLLIDAFAALAPRHPDWRLVVLGEGPERAALVGRTQAAGCGDRVRFPGRAGNPADWYRRADAFVLSSRFEGFPNVLVEAMAHGCAVVATDCPTGPRDIVHDGADGLLVAPAGGVQALGDALDRLMSDDALRARLGAAARGVAQRFSLEDVVDRWAGALAGSTRVER